MAFVIIREPANEHELCEAALGNPDETRNLERSLFALGMVLSR
jgi:hypothetical protein